MDVTPVCSPPIYIYFSYFIVPGIRRRKQHVLFNSIYFYFIGQLVWILMCSVRWQQDFFFFTLQPNCTEIFLKFFPIDWKKYFIPVIFTRLFFALVLSFLGDFLTYYKFTYVFYKAKTLKQKKKIQHSLCRW